MIARAPDPSPLRRATIRQVLPAATDRAGARPAAATRVGVCDDHPLARAGIEAVIASTAGFELVLRAADAAELLDGLDRQVVDICVVDLRLPDIGGMDLIPLIAERDPDAKVLVVTAHCVDDVGFACLDAGASGFLAKGFAPSQLLAALHALRRGAVYVPPGSIDRRTRGAAEPVPAAALSPREKQVLHRLAHGERIVDIARAMRLDPHRVATYRRRVFEKLGVRSTAALTAYAIRHDLVSIEDLAGDPIEDR